ncbi:MAG: PilZ domain-containing protein [Candidatus Omnitrophota bacterium]
MRKSNPAERRLHPRLEQALPIRVAVNGYDFSTATQNVSCLGACCHIEKYMPPFTKVLVKLNLPLAAEQNKRASEVKCSGVVVRTDDEAQGGFNIAIFFNEIKDTQKKKIAQYISQFLS